MYFEEELDAKIHIFVTCFHKIIKKRGPIDIYKRVQYNEIETTRSMLKAS